MSFIAELTAPDAKTIKMVLKEPFGLVIDMLGKTGGNVAFMMPKRVADTDPNKQITDATGSGPFIFKKDEWKAGEKAVYLKNPKYKPRNEPPSGFAGGKVAKVDRIEWIWIPDTQTQVNALLNGEVDLIEAMPYDLLPLVEKDKNIKVQTIDKAGRQYILRFNTLLKPFDNPKVRQAVVYALRQKPFLEANVGDARFYSECKSLFPCGLPLESSKGWEDRLNGDTAEARQLLQEAGYDGTPIVMLHQTDLVNHSSLAPVAKPQLEAAGFKVDLQSMDWQTLVPRRTKKDPADKGGWHIFFTSSGALSIPDPVSTLLPQRLVREVDVRLAVRCRHREAARGLRPRDRRGQASRDRPAGAVPRDGVSDLRAARPVHRADRDAQQRDRPAPGAGHHLLECREEVTANAPGACRLFAAATARKR